MFVIDAKPSYSFLCSAPAQLMLQPLSAPSPFAQHSLEDAGGGCCCCRIGTQGSADTLALWELYLVGAIQRYERRQCWLGLVLQVTGSDLGTI